MLPVTSLQLDIVTITLGIQLTHCSLMDPDKDAVEGGEEANSICSLQDRWGEFPYRDSLCHESQLCVLAGHAGAAAKG